MSRRKGGTIAGRRQRQTERRREKKESLREGKR